MAAKPSSASPSLPIFAQLMGGVNKKIPLYLPTGTTVEGFKNILCTIYPEMTVMRVIFSGAQFKEDSKALAELGIYKECTIQCMLRRRPKEELDNLHRTKMPRFHRKFTEESIQFGDVVIIHVIQAKQLSNPSENTANPYCFITFGDQIQSGSVRPTTLDPVWNETFGFYIDFLKGLPKTDHISIGVYHNVDAGDDKSLGEIHVRVDDIPRNEAVNRFCKLETVGSGEVLLSIHRAPITSPQLADILMKIINMQQPWSREMLNKFNVTLGSFLGTQPWQLPDDVQVNPALQHLNDLMSKNQLDFQNIRTVAKVRKILQSQETVVTEDGPCSTLYLSDLSLNESDLFTYLHGSITPNGVKSLLYCEPVVTIDNIKDSNNSSNGKVSGYCIVQFKSALLSVRALLAMKLKGIHFTAGFGPPKEADESGQIAAEHTSLLEGFLQVSIPTWRAEQEEEKKSNKEPVDNQVGENLFANDEDAVEYPQYWCIIADEMIVGYRSLQDTAPAFEISTQELQIRPSGAWAFDLIDPSTNDQYNFRSQNTALILLWQKILSDCHDGKVHINPKTMLQSQREAAPDKWTNHECYLSHKQLALSHLYSPDGHKWFADRKMLNTYVKNCLTKGQLQQITTRFTVSDLKDILSREVFEDYSERSLKALIDRSQQYIRCPNCSTPMELETFNIEGTLTPEEENTMKKLRDDDGNKLSEQSQSHYRQYRLKCNNSRDCGKEFCHGCFEVPYHIGRTCEEFRGLKDAPHCRFCDVVLEASNRIKNPTARSLANVCTKPECMQKMKLASVKILTCGHYCLGVRDEETDCYCLVKGCPEKPKDIQCDADDNCTICGVEKFSQAPTIVLECNHVFHYQCVQRILEGGWKTAFISFEFAQCPLCKQPINHPTLKEVLEPLRDLENVVRQNALQRLRYEEKQNDDDVADPKGRFYRDEVGYAEHYYAFFQCYECKKPYFGGAKECKAQDDDDNEVDKKDLTCMKCQKLESVDECDEHGSEYLVYKCRYCCNMSVFHCWGKVHFCKSCHQPGVWDKLSTYSTGKNQKGIEEYGQCDGVRKQLKELQKDARWSTWSREEKDKQCMLVRADPDDCPLHCRHPPNGFEFGLGCSLCEDKKADGERQKLKEKIEKELKNKVKQIMKFMDNVPSGTKFVHRAPMDDNGVLYCFGTHGKTRQYSNPADANMVVVTTSEMMPDSEHFNTLVGRKVVRCVTKPSASCWFAVDFVDKCIKPTHYTLRHYISWDTECLRNWVIEGSLDGERWLVLRQHQNDAALNSRGQAYTWALHDYGCAFRRFRVKQTGHNNNNHYFLACSGFEVYGTLFKDDTADTETNYYKAYDEQQKMKSMSLVRFWQMVENGSAGVYHFTYENDFDENGILHFLGAKGGQQDWVNPALRDEVAVCSSALVKDSAPIHCLTGHEARRLVTKPEDNAWMQVDFKDKLIQPSYYTIRHYSTWDTECLRNWILQASNDGIHWITVKKHEEDTALSEKGQSHTWPVQGRGAYRIWRIKQTGLNSNKHKYLACSGIEFYGQLYLTKFDPLAHVSDRQGSERLMAQLRLCKRATFVEDNDKNGVVYWVGTRGGTSNWVNPGSRNWVRCTASTLMRDSQPVHSLCGRISVRCVTQPLENSWMAVDLKNFWVCPTHYTLRHYISWDTEALRNWVLEGSFDGVQWVVLRAHRNDASLNHKGATATWEIRSKGALYRCFRIRQTGANSNKHLYNSCSGFEVYGAVHQIGNPNPRAPQTGKEAPHGEAADVPQMDVSLTGQVPWDTEEAEQPETQGGTAGGDADEESQDMALLREMARQEKQRLIHHLSTGNPYPFFYARDMDENGILYFLGTDWRTAPWRNPSEMGVVTVQSSRLAKDSAPTHTICGRKVVRCVCMAEKNNWFLIDFRNLYVRLTHYTLRHYDSWDTECLRNWYLEGTNDLKKFKVIKQHKNDQGLNGKGSTFTWQIDAKQKRYRAFRIRQFDKNSNKHWYLALSGMEFYGEVFFRPK